MCVRGVKYFVAHMEEIIYVNLPKSHLKIVSHTKVELY